MPPKALQELESELSSIRAALAVIDDLEDPSEVDLNEQATLIARYDEIEPKAVELRERMANLDRIRKDAEDQQNREEPQAPTMFVRSNLDPEADLERVAMGLVSRDEVRARAETLLERDEKRRNFGQPGYAEEAYRRMVDTRGVDKH